MVINNKGNNVTSLITDEGNEDCDADVNTGRDVMTKEAEVIDDKTDDVIPRNHAAFPPPVLRTPTQNVVVKQHSLPFKHSGRNSELSKSEMRNSVSPEKDEIELHDTADDQNGRASKEEWKTVTRANRKSSEIGTNGNELVVGDANLAKRGINKLTYAATVVNSLSVNKQVRNTTQVQTKRVKKINSPQLLVGTSDDDTLVGAKKAWFHLGKVKQGTTVEAVRTFVDKVFPGIEFDIEKLESKGINESFRVGCDFTFRDKVMDSKLWPRNTTLKRFLFWKTSQKAKR